MESISPLRADYGYLIGPMSKCIDRLDWPAVKIRLAGIRPSSIGNVQLRTIYWLNKNAALHVPLSLAGNSIVFKWNILGVNFVIRRVATSDNDPAW